MVGHRAVREALDEPRRERRRDDRELDRARGRPSLVGEHVRRGHVTVGLDGREDPERSVPVAVEGVHALVRRARAVDEQGSAPPAARMGLEDGAGGAHGELEARVGRLADDHARVGVQEHGGLVARRVLELLDHQLPALGGGRPVDATQRLPLLVLAGRCAGRSPNGRRMRSRRPSGVRAPDSENRRSSSTRRGYTRIAAPVGSATRHALEAEGILDDDLGLLHGVAAARHAAQRVAAAEPPVPAYERGFALAEPRDALPQDERARGDRALLVELDLDGDVVAGEPLPLAELRAAAPWAGADIAPRAPRPRRRERGRGRSGRAPRSRRPTLRGRSRLRGRGSSGRGRSARAGRP